MYASATSQKKERSSIYFNNKVIGQEVGVSVYEAIKGGKEIKILLPSLTYQACVTLSGCLERKMLIVQGDKVGIGSDGEVLLRNVKILERVKKPMK